MAQNLSPTASTSDIKRKWLIPIKKSSINIRLDLTEENLDLLLRQEYTLSQMCYEADQLSLEVLDNTKSFQTLKNWKASDADNKEDAPSDQTVIVQERREIEDKTITNINISKQVVVDQKSHDMLSMDQINLDNIKLLIMQSAEESFKCGMNGPDLVPLYNFSQSKYRDSFEYMWKEKINEIQRIMLEHRFLVVEKKSLAHALIPNDPRGEKVEGNVGKKKFFFKIKNLVNTLRIPKNPKHFSLNSNISDNIYFPDQLHICSDLQPLISRTFDKKMDEINCYSNTNRPQQHLISSVNSCPVREPHILNKTTECIALKEKSVGLDVDKNSECISSIGGLALTSSFQDIEFIDADVESESPETKTDCENSKAAGNKMIELEEFLKTFTSTANFETQLNDFQTVVSVKSNLKRKISPQNSNKKNKLKKSGLKFTNVTIFYFERSQGFSSIPTKGGSTLGMVNHHFYISTIPIDEYEHKKNQKGLPKLRASNTIYSRKMYAKDKSKNVQALTLHQRVELLESAAVQIELKEEDDCAYIRASRASAGCDCKDYCEPDICDCSLAGIECQVDRPNFPCGCSKENCRNVMGRNEYNHGKVKTHFIKTIRKIKLENKGRISKRKQASPSKVLINSSDIKADIDMIQV